MIRKLCLPRSIVSTGFRRALSSTATATTAPTNASSAAASDATIVKKPTPGHPDIIVEYKDNGVAVMSLNRLEGKNALSKDMLREFVDVTNEIKANHAVRAVVLKSNVPKVFCAGADLKERLNMPDTEVGPFVSSLREAFYNFSQIPVPVIAAIEGAALGGGLELALSCDLRVAGTGALLGLPEVALAIIPGAGGTQRLSRTVGVAKAKELIYLAKRMNGSEAASIGLVNECVEAGAAEARALEMAGDIAKQGPIAIRMAKAAIDGGSDVDVATGLMMEKECYAQVIFTQDRKEGLKAFTEKRSPKYEGK